jgi:hypothetical protein
MTWNGSRVSAEDTETHYLHLSAFPCEKCSGPVIVGLMGTRRDDISKETDIRKVGAACIACGFKPEIMVEPAVEHQFRPVEWNWVIRDNNLVAGSNADPLPADSPQNAHAKP